MSCHAAKALAVKTASDTPEAAATVSSQNNQTVPPASAADDHDAHTSSSPGQPQSQTQTAAETAERDVATAGDAKPHADGEIGATIKRTSAQVISKDEPLAVKKRRVIELKTAELLGNKDKYYDNLGEIYFLKDGGQLMDLLGWLRKPTPSYLEYLRTRLLDPVEDEPQRILNVKASSDGGRGVRIGTPVATPPATPILTLGGRATGREIRDHHHHNASATNHGHSGSNASVPSDGRTSPSISVCSGDELAERAKHEAHVLQRVAALRKVGLWAQQRLPKVQEPPRAKAHWDYLLEEMKWMSNDFAQERKLKKAIARKCARMCQKYHQEKELRAQRAERDEQQRIRKLAATIAKDVKTFWSNAEKLLEFRIHTKVAAKRKEALDLQLNLLVDRTEKFSDQIRDKLAVDTPSGTAAPSVADTMSDVQERDNDDDFVEDSSEEDDEETIAKQERREKVDHKQELNELEGDNALSVEELLAKYYSQHEDARETGDRSGTPSDESMDEDVDDDDNGGDEDDEDNEEDDDDDEESAEENGKDEVMEDGASQRMDASENADAETQDKDKTISMSSDATEIKEKPQVVESCKEHTGGTDTPEEDEDKLGGLTAVAEKFQPKGLDLATAQVKTPVPFLLKHTLREYQHVGLDWLVAMCEQRLNGILADEMGLGKTIQTISLLAHLACERGVWGPHLVVVPTSVMLNWEMEFKKWCPGFKILTYYGSVKERKAKRIGWTKKNTFHVCITSYKLVVQDHAAFRRKPWYYLILDEAQNIKNFKSQRWQLLVNFQAERRLLLTGTPLQNTLMELWSLMHFLMPHLFESHKEFREWFANPLTGMVEGSSEYNEALVKRLHRVLRPFLLRRLKSEVEQQMPQKYEHILMCRLSKRQRFLYDDFMSQGKTRETLASGKLLSVLNVLMQLRKVCNHPALFEPRPVSSPFRMEGLVYRVPSLLLHMESPLKTLFASLNLHLADLELVLTAFAAHRIKKFQTTPQYIEGAENHPATPPRCPSGKIRLHIRTTTTPATAQVPRPPVLAQVGTTAGRVVSGQLRAASTSQTGRIVMLGQRPDAAQGQTTHAQPVTFQLVQKAQGGQAGQLGTPQSPMTLHVQQTGTSRTATGALHRIVQTTSGQHILLTTAPQPATGATTAGTTAAAAIRPGGLVRMPVAGAGQVQTAQNPALQAVQSQRPQSLLSPHKPVVTTVGSSVGVIPQTIASRPPTPVAAGTPPRSIIATTSHALVAGQKTTTGGQMALTGAASAASAVAAQRKVAAAVASSAAAAGGAVGGSGVATTGGEKTPFFIDSLEKKRRTIYQGKLKLLGRINNMRCAPGPVYGQDLIEAVSVTNLEDRVPPTPPKRVAPLQTPYPEEVPEHAVRRAPYGTGVGHLYTQNIHSHTSWWSDTNALRELVPSPDLLWEQYEAQWNQFLCIHPRVSAPPIEMHASHPPPHLINGWRQAEARMRQELRPKLDLLARIGARQQTQFPDRRLIQFDCGKLQTLDQLLVQLKSGGHRVLIFTQMARMLDVLEEFLTMHGHTYLRLDGATDIEQRQVLVERFNSDKRLFCFILSTRSGGVGLNLTGADTVVFYDSDWNPTMDAQAQDRCHRIGQTRDVHIYRLVSERTVEENILRKANQKRMLGELAIEGGNFTTSFFRSNTITDLFEDQTIECTTVKKEVSEEEETPMTSAELRREQEDFERTLNQVEEEADAKAAKRARAEASADLAEFDEEIAYQENRNLGTEETEEERVLMSQLNNVEKYALRFLETQHDFEDLKQAEEQVEAQKREWMLNRLQSQKEREEAMKETPPLISYKRPHSPQEAFLGLRDSTVALPLWAPPTPPAGDDDVYVDNAQLYLYDSEQMPENALPPVYVRKNASKRLRTDSTASGTPLLRRGGLSKAGRAESHGGPKSLFDRPSDVLVKLRKEAKMLKLKRQPPTSGPLMAQRTQATQPPITGPAGSPTPPGAPATPGQPTTPATSTGTPRRQAETTAPEGNQVEWTISEDWAILQVIQHLQELPSSLTILSPGHLPNWDLVADLLNSSVARVYRSPKQCRNRFENVLAPREEGRPNAPITAYDKKSVKKALKQKTGRLIKTGSLFAADSNASFNNMYTSRFDVIKTVSVHHAPALRPVFANTAQPNGRNTKHAAVMAEHGVNYDNPQHPQTLAKLREERVRKEKGTKATTAVTQQQQQQVQHQVQQPAQAQQHQQAQQQPQQQQQQPQQQQSQQSQQSHVQQQAGATAMVSAPAVATAQFTTSGVVARAMPNAGATIPQSQNSATTTTGTSIVTSATSVAHTTVPSVMAVVGGVGGVTSAHQVTPATEAQKIVTNAQPQPIVAVRSSTPIRTTQLMAATPVVSVTSLSQAQLQAAAQRSMANRSVTPSQQLQFQAIKHSTLIRQQGTGATVRTSGEPGGQMKRIQQVVTSQAIKVTSQVAPGQLVTHTTQAGVAKVGPLGQIVGQVGQTVKTATGARTVVNESELTQLLKRNQTGQQKILATGATLVKPSGVPLPVSAVTVTGITLPVAAATAAAQAAKGGPSSSGGQQRIVFQQVKKQQQLQQGTTSGAKTVSSGGLQTTTVQIVHQQPGTSGIGGTQTQSSQAIKPVAVSQIIKHVLPSGQQSNYVLTTTSSAGSSTASSMGAMGVTGMGGSAHAQSAQTQLFTALQQGVKSGGVATVTLTAPSSTGAPTRILTVQGQPKAVLGKQHGTETAVVQIPMSSVGSVNPMAVQAAIQVARAQQAAVAAAQGKAPQGLPYTMRIRHSTPQQHQAAQQVAAAQAAAQQAQHHAVTATTAQAVAQVTQAAQATSVQAASSATSGSVSTSSGAAAGLVTSVHQTSAAGAGGGASTGNTSGAQVVTHQVVTTQQVQAQTQNVQAVSQAIVVQHQAAHQTIVTTTAAAQQQQQHQQHQLVSTATTATTSTSNNSAQPPQG